jgi:hypothetical protein
MRLLWSASLLVIVAGVACADEPEPEQLRAIGSQAVPARDAWERCTASLVRKELGSNRAAEAIADQALIRCKVREDRLRAVLAARIGGQKASTVVMQLRDLHRDSLVAVIGELRRR